MHQTKDSDSLSLHVSFKRKNNDTSREEQPNISPNNSILNQHPISYTNPVISQEKPKQKIPLFVQNMISNFDSFEIYQQTKRNQNKLPDKDQNSHFSNLLHDVHTRNLAIRKSASNLHSADKVKTKLKKIISKKSPKDKKESIHEEFAKLALQSTKIYSEKSSPIHISAFPLSSREKNMRNYAKVNFANISSEEILEGADTYDNTSRDQYFKAMFSKNKGSNFNPIIFEEELKLTNKNTLFSKNSSAQSQPDLLKRILPSDQKILSLNYNSNENNSKYSTIIPKKEKISISSKILLKKNMKNSLPPQKEKNIKSHPSSLPPENSFLPILPHLISKTKKNLNEYRHKFIENKIEDPKLFNPFINKLDPEKFYKKAEHFSKLPLNENLASPSISRFALPVLTYESERSQRKNKFHLGITADSKAKFESHIKRLNKLRPKKALNRTYKKSTINQNEDLTLDFQKSDDLGPWKGVSSTSNLNLNFGSKIIDTEKFKKHLFNV